MMAAPEIVSAAISYHAVGLTPIPVAPDGSKRPLIKSWTEWQDATPDLPTTLKWFAAEDADGLGILTGGPSRREVMEFEGRAITEGLLEQYTAAAHAAGLGDLWDRVRNGYVTQSPSGGQHNHIVVTDADCLKNTKLARRPSTPDELADWQATERAKLPDITDPQLRAKRAANIDASTPDKVTQVLIETRGQGGFIVMAPSAGRTHATGNAWTVVTGTPGNAAHVTAAERDSLYALARTLDRMPTRPAPAAPRPAPVDTALGAGLRPGDRFNLEARWEDILIPHGWTEHSTRGRETFWTRPGKNKADGISATTGRNDGDNLFVFSSSTDFEPEQFYTKFSAYALLEHAGNHTAAAIALAPLYGDHLGVDEDLSGLIDASSYRPPAVEASNVIPLHRNDGSTALQAAPEPVDIDPAEIIVDRLAREELFKLRARARAKEWFHHENIPAAEPFDLDTLADVLARPADPPQRIAELMPWAAAMLLIAQRKAGKTTFELNLARTLITGGDFLGRFPVIPIKGTVALLNYEVSARQIATWADEHGVNRDKLVLVNLRGRRNPLADPDDTTRLATELRARQVETVIVDPFGRAYTGQSQNDAGEVGQWLIRLDEFVRGQVGALDLILTAHAGWNGERTRGSSALEDWGDVLVNITRDKDDNDEDATGSERYFRAEGRDVDIAEDLLLYDETTRTLTLAGSGGRQQRRKTKKVDGLVGPILEVVRSHPGIGSKDLTRRLREGLGGGVRDESVSAAVKHLVETGQVWRPPYKPGIPWPINPGQQPLTHPGSTR